MQKITAQELQDNPIHEVINGINAGAVIEASLPLIKQLFGAISDWIAQLRNNKDSPKNVRLRLAAVEAKDLVQKELNKLFEERLLALENTPQ